MSIYKPLERPTSIRLIELLGSARANSPLRCRIRHADLDDSPGYNALSYVWGDESDPGAICCDGVPLPITRSLEAALRHLRLPGKALVLWADAICINQRDTTGEKEVQIPLMGRVYSQAAEVLIWLGEESSLDDPNAAFECAQQLWDRLGPRFDEFKTWRVQYNPVEDFPDFSKVDNVVHDVDAINQHFSIPPADSPGYGALDRLLQLPWFTRAWTFQESFLARSRRFVLGSRGIDGVVMMLVVEALIILNRKTGRSYFTAVGDIMSLSSMVSGQQPMRAAFRDSLVGLLSLRRGAACRFPSDLVYSLLGIHGDSSAICVEYDKPFGQVFGEVVVEHIRNSGSLSVLGQVDVATSDLSTASVPSWVPDWRKVSGHHLFSRVHYDLGEQLYSCTGPSKPRLVCPTEASELHITGVEFDKVLAIIPRKTLDFELVFSQFTSLLNKDGLYEPTGEVPQVAGMRTKCADLDVSLFDKGIGAKRLGPDPELLMEIMSAAVDKSTGAGLHAKLRMMSEDTRPIVTRDGRFGLAPLSVREGDVVCLMLGGEAPLLLRPSAEGLEGKYIFAGECYLHGFMDGEGLIEARNLMYSLYNKADTAWLHRLHEPQPFPFVTAEFCIR
ncbi:heterokaryon incompatibility protein-domain-containing protein [Lasiosphaeria ovina]|uniref:Heterokaryon incompatibility protein-domain-containing protein n=1 Tax=Lasiosphaeria ovina TaxID=92902 RepID=A0AAE0NJ86_9PEZI|nr:heterokaryon incompatibility protein-domain-containing protein [Lasiosphaeria ovina]